MNLVIQFGNEEVAMLSVLNDYRDGVSLYRSLGVRPLINATATLTVLGGSLMPPGVLEAMASAAQCFVDINELQTAVGRRLAELTHNEAALVVGGCAAGLTEVFGALMVGTDPDLIKQLPDTTGLKDEVLIHRTHRNPYDQAVRTSGARLVEFGQEGRTTTQDLIGAITDKTVAVFYVVATWLRPGALTLEDTIAVAHEHGLPVIVDAAAQIPPARSLWHFTRDLGADVAVFSGGKNLNGPQATGLVVGKKSIIDAVARNGYPNQSIGRPMKIGKENIVGLLAAVEWYLSLDHAGRRADWERQLSRLSDRLAGLPGVIVEQSWPGEAGEDVPWALVVLEPGASRLDRDALIATLNDGDPKIVVGSRPRGISVYPATLKPGEMEIIGERLVELLGKTG
jgi:D-glucosaminate-6-phosphate ammonia-lyase